jgi:hypothetical protein
MHTHIHTYIHSYIHTCMRAYTHTHSHICEYMHACIHTYIHACMRTYIHTYLYGRKYIKLQYLEFPAENKKYDGCVFYRAEKAFVLQARPLIHTCLSVYDATVLCTRGVLSCTYPYDCVHIFVNMRWKSIILLVVFIYIYIYIYIYTHTCHTLYTNIDENCTVFTCALACM